MTLTEPITVTPLHRLAAVLRYLDAEPGWASHVPSSDVRALIVGDLARPAYTALRTDTEAWLWRVARAAEVVAWSSSNDEYVTGMRNVLLSRPDGA